MKYLISVGRYLSTLGNKSSRGDIWVICIAIAFLSCLSGVIPCVANELTMTIIIGMFADLGVENIKEGLLSIKTKPNESKEH